MTVHSNCRDCPVCEHGKVAIDELPEGARCTYCHAVVEIEFLPAIAAPILLLGLLTLCFKNDIGWLGLIFTFLLVAYAVGFKFFNATYMPLKAYEDINQMLAAACRDNGLRYCERLVQGSSNGVLVGPILQESIIQYQIPMGQRSPGFDKLASTDQRTSSLPLRKVSVNPEMVQMRAFEQELLATRL